MRNLPLKPALVVIGWLTILAAVTLAPFYGISLRRWTWEQTRTVRFTGDIDNGFNLGRMVIALTGVPAGRPISWPAYVDAYLRTYRHVIDRTREQKKNTDYHLDYAPGRLLVMTLWVKHLHERNITAWDRRWETTAPLMRFNTVMSGVSAIAMWLLVRHWRRAGGGWSVWPDYRRPWREWPALLAGLAVWFNPALIWETHAWLQWDVWLVPFLLLGMLAASKQQWLAAGFITILGAFFKGQVLMVLPVLIAWPLLSGKPLAAMRFVVGAVLAASLVSLAWIARDPSVRLWLIVASVAVATTVTLTGWRRRFDALTIAVAAAAGLAILFVPLGSNTWPGGALSAATLAAAAIVLPRWTPRALWPVMLAALAAGGIFVAGIASNESYDWFEIAYRYPVDRRLRMSIGPITNLPALLGGRPFYWGVNDAVDLPGELTLTMRQLLACVFGLTLLLCALGASLHERRRDPRVLLALFTPWLLMFAILPQMHERYLIWAAVLLAAGMGLSVGSSLLAVVVMFLAWVNMAGSMIGQDRGFLPDAYRMIRGMMPGAAWAVMLLAAVYLYLSLAIQTRHSATAGARISTD